MGHGHPGRAKLSPHPDDAGPIVCTAWDRTRVCSDALDRHATREAQLELLYQLLNMISEAQLLIHSKLPDIGAF